MVSSDSIARHRPRSHDGRGTSEIAVFAATEQLLRESSLQDITVAQIISRASLSRANFYHYFASKYDVIAAMVARLLDTQDGPRHAEIGQTRKQAMEADLRQTVQLWSDSDALICAVVEHMHAVPQLAAAWNLMLDRFVSAIAAQITHEREANEAPQGAPAALIATVLVCGYERTFYVGARAHDQRLPNPEAAVDSIIALTLAAVYGERRVLERPRRAKRRPAGKTVDSTAAPSAVSQPDDGTNAAGGDPETAAVIRQATNSLLDELSLDQLSVAKILERAKISRATFYFYYENKDDAFVALFEHVAAEIVRRFGNLATIDRTDPDQIRSLVTHWLDLDPSDFGVLRNAIREWPRRPQLRRRYLGAIATMADVLEAVIETDRAAGTAIPGPPAPHFAAVLLWTIERSIAGSLAGEANLEDTDAVVAFLGDLLVSAVYGR